MKEGLWAVGLAVVAMTGMAGADAARAAGQPVALVEEVIGQPKGVELMDYLAAGRKLRFAPGEGAVIAYMSSCVRERIVGGTAVIGEARSAVVGGTVARGTVPCDAGGLALSTDEAAKSGVVVFRAPPRPTRPAAVELTLYGLSPVVDLPGGGRLVVERLDRPGERTVIDVAASRLVRGRFYDFARNGRRLAAGGTYRAIAHERSITFKVDPSAAPGEAPLVGRLLRF